MDLAEAVLRSIGVNQGKKLNFLYNPEQPLEEKLQAVACRLYGADGVELDRNAVSDLELLKKTGMDKLPVCIAKTPLSLSDNSKLRGRPGNFRITVNELRVSAGAGFIVAVCGNIVTMPGLPRFPAALKIRVLGDGTAVGLS